MSTTSVNLTADWRTSDVTSTTSDNVGRGPPSEVNSATDFKKHETKREKLRHFLHSQQFHLIVCVLIILDIVLIIVELLAEMRVLESNIVEDTEHKESKIAHWAHNVSIGVLIIFLIEIFVKIYALGVRGFLQHKLEVFDAFIVIISLIFDLVFYKADSAAAIGSGLIITLRLWRVGRLLNGIVLTVKIQAELQLEKEIKLRENLKQKMMTQRDYCNALEQENKYLRQLLEENNIKAPPPVDPPELEINLKP